MICDDKVGYNQQIIFDLIQVDIEKCNAFLDEQRQIVKTGFISVEVPQWLIDRWRAKAGF